MIATGYEFSNAPGDTLLHEEPWGEQHFPTGLGRYASERSRGPLGQLANCVHDNPWLSIGIALGAGLLLAALARPVGRLACRSSRC